MAERWISMIFFSERENTSMVEKVSLGYSLMNGVGYGSRRVVELVGKRTYGWELRLRGR